MQARSQYLADVKPSNAELDTLMRLAKGYDMGAIRRSCNRLAAELDTFARKLAAGRWPASAKAAVRSLIGGLALDRVVYQECASATTWDDLNSALGRLSNASTAEAEQVRIALGLPGTS